MLTAISKWIVIGRSGETPPFAPAARRDSGVEADHKRYDQSGVSSAKRETTPPSTGHGQNTPHLPDTHSHR